MQKLIVLLAASLAASAALAQHSHDHAPHGKSRPSAAAHSQYAGMQSRSVKALSEQQIAALRAGKGMSLALPAELNGYPGPAHVLELADALRLTGEQKARTEELFSRMQEEAKVAGEEVISAETDLDALFKERRATAERLREATSRAAQAQGRLRETHLRYHLTMLDVNRTGYRGGLLA